jgi:hypothetical protein
MEKNTFVYTSQKNQNILALPIQKEANLRRAWVWLSILMDGGMHDYR